MSSSTYYARLLREVEQHFKEEPQDWATVRAWLERASRESRERTDTFVPTTLEELGLPPPTLQPGDIVQTPILSQQEQFEIPPRCRIGASVFALGAVQVGRDVQVENDIIALGSIHWRGGNKSRTRNLVAPLIRVDTPAGIIDGGLWCGTLETSRKGCHLANDMTIFGPVVVAAPPEQPFTVGARARAGALHVAGAVATHAGVRVSHLYADGPLTIGRDNRIGYAEGEQVTLGPGSTVATIVSHGDVAAGEAVTVDTIRASGDITLAASTRVTGQVIVAEGGVLRVPPGEGWHTQRDHWFYRMPDNSLRPYTEDASRPEGAHFVAIRNLNHRLWEQSVRLAGKGSP